MKRDEPQRNSARTSGESSGGSGWITTRAAAKALGVSRRTVQGYVHRGLLEARQEGEGVKKTFYISIDSLNTLRDKRIREAQDTESFAEVSPKTRTVANIDEVVGETLRRIAERLEARTAEAAELRARLELTARSESSLREDLEREREERERAQEEVRTLREELEAERGRGFWKVGVVVGSMVTIFAALLAVFNEIFH
jgi:hypothetical protein